MVGDLLRHFQLATVLQIGRNAGGAESMIANPRFDAGRFRAPADDAVGVLLEEGIGGKLASLAAGTAEEIAVDVIGDAGRFDIVLCAVGNPESIFATAINLKRMDVNSVSLIISQNKIATPTTATWHMAIASIFQKVAEGREIGMVDSDI